LQELKKAWYEVDSFVHVNQFTDAAVLESIFEEKKFKKIKIEEKLLLRFYPKLKDIVNELKGIGAHNINDGQAKGLTGKNALIKFKQAYEKNRDMGKGLPVTYQVYYLQLLAQ